MKNNLHITITIYKACKLLVFLLRWQLVPQYKKDHRLGSKKETVCIRTNEGDHGTMNITRRYRSGRIFRWLCFKLQFITWDVDKDVDRIYPRGYDHTNDPYWKQKFESLNYIGYFN